MVISEFRRNINVSIGRVSVFLKVNVIGKKDEAEIFDNFLYMICMSKAGL